MELVRRAFADYAREGVRLDRGHLAPDVVWNPADEPPQHGPQAVAEYMARWEREWQDLHTSAEGFVGAGDRVLVTVRFSGRGRLSGAQVEARTYEVYTVRDAQIIRMDEFTDRSAALEAAGLSE